MVAGMTVHATVNHPGTELIKTMVLMRSDGRSSGLDRPTQPCRSLSRVAILFTGLEPIEWSKLDERHVHRGQMYFIQINFIDSWPWSSPRYIGIGSDQPSLRVIVLA